MGSQVSGPGWAWLVYNKATGSLEITFTLENDQIAVYEPSLVPLLTINLWETAYYCDYETRSNYLESIWSIIDWRRVADRYK